MTPALDKEKVMEAIGNIDLNQKICGHDLMAVYNRMRTGEFDLAPTVDLSTVDTAALVDALKGREGVDAIEIDHTDDYHVIRSDEFDDEIGSLEPVWSDQGPVTLIRIVQKEAR